MICPSDRAPFKHDGASISVSYGINAIACGTGNLCVKLNRHHSKTFIAVDVQKSPIGEGKPYRISYGENYLENVYAGALRHENNVNLLMLDGHVEGLKKPRGKMPSTNKEFWGELN